jgi:hypothetical protein
MCWSSKVQEGAAQVVKKKGRPCGGPEIKETFRPPCQETSHQPWVICIERSMVLSVSLPQRPVKPFA